MQMYPCLLADNSMTSWEDHGTEQTFKGVIEVIGQMYGLRANLDSNITS